MAGAGNKSCRDLASPAEADDVVKKVQKSMSFLQGNLPSTSIEGDKNQFFQGCTFNVNVQQSSTVSSSAGNEEKQTADKLKHFVNGLKSQYKHRYLSVRPAPYYTDKWKSINEVFIENTFERMGWQEDRFRLWEIRMFHSRHQVITPCLKAERVVIHSEPGYGKSTLLQQYAHDWCTSSSDSPLQKVSIFILLRLKDLGDTKSIYDAIRSLLPLESTLTTDNIKDILTKGKVNVLFAFDGLDEYPYCDVKNNDITKIINGQMFGSSGVIVTTRPHSLQELSCIPMIRYRLPGFDRRMQEIYLAKLLPTNRDKRTEIMSELDENDLLAVLCQSPLFFTSFAHAMNDDLVKSNFDCVTSYFSHMIACCFSHLRHKLKKDFSFAAEFISERRGHRESLAKLAYDSLSSKPPNLVWSEETISQELGLTCFELYTKVGILLKEEERIFINRRGSYLLDHLKVHTRVSFFHTTVQEYYAALYSANILKTNAITRYTNILNKIDLNNFHYVFQFVCGLDPIAARQVIAYLRNLDEAGQMLATLCLLEQGGEEADDTIAELCKKQTVFFHEDSKLLQRSKIQLLQMAFRREIPIFSVCLFHCFDRVSPDGQSLRITSGVHLPRLNSLKMLMIDEIKDLHCETQGMLEYAAKCLALESLSKFEIALLPKQINAEQVLECLKRKKCEVQWFYKGNFWQLDLSSGEWMALDHEFAIIRENVYVKERSWKGNDSQPMENKALFRHGV